MAIKAIKTCVSLRKRAINSSEVPLGVLNLSFPGAQRKRLCNKFGGLHMSAIPATKATTFSLANATRPVKIL